MNWQLEFIAWHIATNHEWDSALHLEAMRGFLREDLETVVGRIWRDAFFGKPYLITHPENTFTGLRAILDGTDPS